MSIAVMALGLASSDPVHCTPVETVLAQAVDVAAETRRAQGVIEEARATRREVRSLWRPQIDAYADSQLGDTELTGARVSNQVGLRVRQRVLDWGDAAIRARQADALLAEEEANASADARDLMLNVADLLATRRQSLSQVALQDEALATFEQRLSALETLAADGLATRQDLAALRGEISARRSQRAQAQLLAERSELLLAERFAVSTESCDIHAFSAPYEVQSTVSMQAESPEERVARARVDAAQQALRLVDRSRLPVVEVEGRASYASVGFDGPWRLREQAGVSLSAPLYSGSMMGARKRQARARLMQAEAELEIAARDARTRLQSLVRERQSLELQSGYSQQAYDELREELAAARQRLVMGDATLDTLIDVRRRLDITAARLFEVQRASFLVEVELLALLGNH